MVIDVFNEDIFKSGVEALVNPVNCVGVMGKGLAFQFDKKFPQACQNYKQIAKAGNLTPGKLVVTPVCYKEYVALRYIIHFPTKRHWQDSSKFEDIALGLMKLQDTYPQYNIKSIAIPPLGCGLGGLDWEKVRPQIVKTFKNLRDVDIYVFNP